MKLHRLSHTQREGAVGQFNALAFFAAARQQADPTAFAAVLVQNQIETARRTPANARPGAGSGQRIRDRAARHGQFRLAVLQHADCPAAPAAQHIKQSCSERRAAKNAAIEQHRVRNRQHPGGRCGVTQRVACGVLVACQEDGEVPRHGRIGHVGQAELDDAATYALRSFIGLAGREEPVHHHVLHFVAGQRR